MIYGRLVKMYLNRLELPSDLLHPLGLVPETKVFGFFHPAHPRPPSSPLSQGDFGFTPFSPDAWAGLLRMYVHLRHQPGALHIFSTFLANNNISVLNAHVVRFGHRYAVWDLVADVRCYKEYSHVGEFDKDLELLRHAARKLEEAIENSNGAKGVLFEKGELKWDESNLAIAPMPLLLDHSGSPQITGTVKGEPKRGERAGGIQLVEDIRWHRSLATAGVLGELLGSAQFCWCIASFQSESWVLRCAPIKNKKLEDLRWLVIRYRRAGDFKSSAGLIAALTGVMTGYNIWMSRNLAFATDEALETGEVHLLAERRKSNPPPWEDLRSDLQACIRHFKGFPPGAGISVLEVAEPMSLESYMEEFGDVLATPGDKPIAGAESELTDVPFPPTHRHVTRPPARKGWRRPLGRLKELISWLGVVWSFLKTVQWED
jgi:hypothetical protein